MEIKGGGGGRLIVLKPVTGLKLVWPPQVLYMFLNLSFALFLLNPTSRIVMFFLVPQKCRSRGLYSIGFTLLKPESAPPDSKLWRKRKKQNQGVELEIQLRKWMILNPNPYRHFIDTLLNAK